MWPTVWMEPAIRDFSLELQCPPKKDQQITSSPLPFSPFLSSSPMASNSSELLKDFSPMMRQFKDGRIERLTGSDRVPASVDPKTGVQSKDIDIAPDINVSARLYLPKNDTSGKKLPLLVYFHGGGFVIESAFSPLYHKHLNLLVAEANVVAVSVNYRLAPEHPVPIAYEDSWLSLKWVASQSADEGKEEWIKDYADFGRVYLGGDSAGANIAHNMAIRFGSEKLDGINLCGIFLNCPYFGGKDPIGDEITYLMQPEVRSPGDLWLYVCPGTTGSDDPRMNPALDSKLSTLGCSRILVYVGEKDFLKDRGWYYKETLIKSGWNGDVEVVEIKGEGHVFSLFHPDGENGMAMLKKVASFLNN